MEIKLDSKIQEKIEFICKNLCLNADILINCILSDYFFKRNEKIIESSTSNNFIKNNNKNIKKLKNNFKVSKDYQSKRIVYLPKIFSPEMAYLMLDLYKKGKSTSQIVNILKQKNINARRNQISEALLWSKQNPK